MSKHFKCLLELLALIVFLEWRFEIDFISAGSVIEKVQKLIFWRERVLNPLHLAREENLLEP